MDQALTPEVDVNVGEGDGARVGRGADGGVLLPLLGDHKALLRGVMEGPGRGGGLGWGHKRIGSS